MATFLYIDLLSSHISFSQVAGLQYQNEGGFGIKSLSLKEYLQKRLRTPQCLTLRWDKEGIIVNISNS